MPEQNDYNIHTDIRFGPLQLVDVEVIGKENEPWFNQSLCRVNECVVRIGVLEGEFHWHHHDDEDEFFYVLEGRLLIEVENRETIELTPGQGYLVPRGIRHRTRAPIRTVLLMFEGAGVVPTGD